MSVEKKLDKIIEDVTELKVASQVQTNQLSEHMRRTELAEKRIDRMERWYLKWLMPLSATVGAFITKAIGLY